MLISVRCYTDNTYFCIINEMFVLARQYLPYFDKKC